MSTEADNEQHLRALATEMGRKLGYEHGLAVGRLRAENELLRAELDGFRRRFCPAGKHYKGSAIQSRRNRETGQMERSTFETYDCWDCNREKRRAECAHDGDIAATKMFMGYGWECSLCQAYFGHIDEPHDEALAAIRAELAAS